MQTPACYLSSSASAQIAKIYFKLCLSTFLGRSLVLQLSSSSTQWEVGSFRIRHFVGLIQLNLKWEWDKKNSSRKSVLGHRTVCFFESSNDLARDIYAGFCPVSLVRSFWLQSPGLNADFLRLLSNYSHYSVRLVSWGSVFPYESSLLSQVCNISYKGQKIFKTLEFPGTHSDLIVN